MMPHANGKPGKRDSIDDELARHRTNKSVPNSNTKFGTGDPEDDPDEVKACYAASETTCAVAVPPAESPNDEVDNPHRLAAGFLKTFSLNEGPHLLRSYRSEFLEWDGSYQPLSDGDLRGRMAEWIRAEFLRVNHFASLRRHDEKRSPPVQKVTVSLVNNVLQALRGMCLLSASTEAPAWIDGATGPEPNAILPVQNGLLDLNSLATGRSGCLHPQSPFFFSPIMLPFAFDANASAPREWLKFLHELWPDDLESIQTLQEWFGYLLTPDTSQQKLLFLLGPKRSGKGTIARVLRELVGQMNSAGPTLGGLATNFGLASLLGKTVAIISDARLSGRTDSAIITERLLSISGEDALTIDRKFRDSITAKLNTRFLILSNELPKLGDSSGALVSRFILLRLSQTFYGHEDHDLSNRLQSELPSILLWAIEGWLRLKDRGRFIQPATGAELIEDMENLSSPVGSFARNRCVIGPEFKIEVAELYEAWKQWCESHGRKEPGTQESFGRDLRAAVPDLRRSRPRRAAGRVNFYAGIRLRVDSDPEPGPGGQGGHSDHALYTQREEEEPCEDRGTMGGHYDHLDQVDPPNQPFGGTDLSAPG